MKSYFALVALLLGWANAVPTCEQIRSMGKALEGFFQVFEELRPTAVRLSFHDCVGGCDGCVNTNDASNAGLAEIASGLKDVYEHHGFAAFGATLADFYAFAGIYAVDGGIRRSNNDRSGGGSMGGPGGPDGPRITADRGTGTQMTTEPGPCPLPKWKLFWGRPVTADCSNFYPEFPETEMTADEMYDYFKTDFGFTKDQVVALMGAHSMGRAQIQNSGYRFSFTPGQEQDFDERFYQGLLHDGWINTDFTPPEIDGEWQHTNDKMALLLNTDINLAYNLTSKESGEATCVFHGKCGLDNSCVAPECPPSSTFNTVRAFAQDCKRFIPAFQEVFQKLLVHGLNVNSLQSTTC